jgi:hypothetical protein
MGCSASSRACLGPTHLYASTCTCACICVCARAREQCAWAVWSVLHVKTHRYVPSADTPTSAVRVPPWLVAGGEAAPPPRQVTITAEASSVSSAAPPPTTAASTPC